MFEKALIRQAEKRDIDIGTLAETTFFYGKTQLLLSRSVVDTLTKMPLDVLLELSSRGCLNLSYVKPIFGVKSSGIIRVHDFGAYAFGLSLEKNRIGTFQEEIAEGFFRAYGNSRSTRNAARHFTDRVKLFRHPGFKDKKTNIICELSKADVVDQRFVRASVAASLQQVAPTYRIPPNFRFDIIDTGDGYAVASDLDFAVITKACLPPFNEGLTAAHLLGFIQEARADTFFAAHYMAELVTTELSSEIIKLKHYDWLRRGDASRKEIDLFTEVATDKFPSIREAVMSGKRSMADFLRLLDQAEKFKSWLQTTNPDQGLLDAYLHEATKGSWADKLLPKSIRVAALNVAALGIETVMPTGLAFAASMVLSEGDGLLLDRIMKGWKPAHFISGPYKKFVDPNNL